MEGTSEQTANLPEFLPLKKTKSLVWNILDFLHAQVNMWRRISIFAKKYFVKYARIRYFTKVI